MNRISSVITGGATMTVASLEPTVQWVLNGCPKPVPPEVVLSISAALVTGIHMLYNVISTWWENRNASPKSTS